MLLQLKNISKGYGESGTHSFRPVLRELNLKIEKGSKIAIIGPSGSGKTTLLNLIGALDIPDSGEVIFDGKNITGYSKKELANFRNQHLGFIFQLHRDTEKNARRHIKELLIIYRKQDMRCLLRHCLNIYLGLRRFLLAKLRNGIRIGQPMWLRLI